MRYLDVHRIKSAWLECLLALALSVLLLQFFPSFLPWTFWGLSKLLAGFVYFLDIRNYSWASWGGMNLLVLFLLGSLRFGPDLREAWKKRSKRLAVERSETEKKQKLREQREILDRIKEGRSRRLY